METGIHFRVQVSESRQQINEWDKLQKLNVQDPQAKVSQINARVPARVIACVVHFTDNQYKAHTSPLCLPRLVSGILENNIGRW